ncbi:MAG TPA: pseudouridine synthase [Mariprofundaceae bacterium]|nr:pseudouridine synthase [Mariprofundaceae bacterium]
MSAPERLDRLLSRIAYGARKDVAVWVKQGRITVAGHPATSPSQKVAPAEVRFDDEPLDHPDGLTLVYHKPLGSVCSHKETGRLIYEDFPEHWQERKPQLASVGRLDKETSGLLILTDDGQLNHHLTSPRHHVPKIYRARLARPLEGHEAALFAAGKLLLEGEDTPCLPAELKVLGECEAELALHEGRYHQVRRMFAAAGNHVEELARIGIGRLALADTGLAAGEFLTIEPAVLLAWIENGERP